MSVFLSLAGGVVAFCAPPKLSKELQSVDPNSNVDVIVQYAQPPTAASNLKVGVLGGVVNRVFGVIKAAVYTVPASSLPALASDPNVTYISPDRPVLGQLDYSAAAVNASAAWQAKLTGSGVGVAVIDSGIDVGRNLSVPGLPSRIVYSEDFTGGNGRDQYGHGTHVAGIIGSNGFSSDCGNCTRSFMGIAPNSSLIDLRVLDGSGQGSDSEVIAAIERAVALKQHTTFG